MFYKYDTEQDGFITEYCGSDAAKLRDIAGKYCSYSLVDDSALPDDFASNWETVEKSSFQEDGVFVTVYRKLV